MKKFQQNMNRELKRPFPDRHKLESQCISAISFGSTDCPTGKGGNVLNLPIWTTCSFACKLEIKGSESNTEGLEEGARERDIHVKVVSSYATKLHINVIVIVFVYQLKVLDTRFIYSAIEIKYKGLDLLVPLWWFVKEEHDPLCIVNLKLLLNRLVFL